MLPIFNTVPVADHRGPWTALSEDNVERLIRLGVSPTMTFYVSMYPRALAAQVKERRN